MTHRYKLILNLGGTVWEKKEIKRRGSDARKVVNHCSLGCSFMRSDKKQLQIGCLLNAVGFCRSLQLEVLVPSTQEIKEVGFSY